MQKEVHLSHTITKTRLFKYIENITSKNWKIQIEKKKTKKKQKNKKTKKKTLIFFIISAQNIDCGYSLEPPEQGGSNVYPQSMFLSKKEK